MIIAIATFEKFVHLLIINEVEALLKHFVLADKNPHLDRKSFLID